MNKSTTYYIYEIPTPNSDIAFSVNSNKRDGYVLIISAIKTDKPLSLNRAINVGDVVCTAYGSHVEITKIHQ